MSDLYLVLRRSLGDVVDWVDLGTDTIRNARKAHGYSYESVARLIPVSAKTWERWEKAGRVPRHLLRSIAGILELEIVFPPSTQVVVDEPASQIAELRREVSDLREMMTELLRRIA